MTQLTCTALPAQQRMAMSIGMGTLAQRRV